VRPHRHLVSLLGALALCGNLLFWLVPLSAMALLRGLLPPRQFRAWCYPVTEFCYRGAVRVNSFWLERVLGMRIEVDGEAQVPRHGSCVVISNHRCWIDILILQAVMVPRGPIVKFLIKRELAWVPVVGWICLSLDFPRLARGAGGRGRRGDFELLRSATQGAAAEPAAFLNFVESTRFSEAKRASQGSRYRHLLNPRSGGLRVLLDGLPPDGVVLDATLLYPPGDPDFWTFLSGDVRRVGVRIRQYRLEAIAAEGIKSWLDARWDEKERLLAAAAQTAA
jgi:1-acyl-sn-glycerol-3-phosphate acyltransferase